jgi:acetyl/propionyl-CoA carboxylase alpha subunit
VHTTLPFHRWVVRDEAFLAGDLSTAFISERWQSEPLAAPDDLRAAAQLAAADERRRATLAAGSPSDGSASPWRTAARTEALR